ncbi:hypothetical protein QW180_26850 [Vibrio sinaloensis]|nr:hypothetical protein [Vibrio sinaloensis]
MSRSWMGFNIALPVSIKKNEVWTDVVYWDSMEAAQAAGQQFASCEDCAPLMALIDPATVDMQHQTIMMSDLAAKYQ